MPQHIVAPYRSLAIAVIGDALDALDEANTPRRGGNMTPTLRHRERSEAEGFFRSHDLDAWASLTTTLPEEWRRAARYVIEHSRGRSPERKEATCSGSRRREGGGGGLSR